ncbi:MAG: hypothetical protein KatS3mg114_0599 [Planctomycetaceae bacterium]|nr:MAG: hypothetical protein KatS3mg114_0599 [Planctomycetaceae bacterium]
MKVGKWLRWCLGVPGLILTSFGWGDVVRLHHGGEIRGKVTSHERDEFITIETTEGVLIQVSRRDVSLVVRRPLKVEEYETRSRLIPDTIPAHWELAEWCREQRLTEQRQEQLQRIVELDPAHEQAHLALGHVWKEGNWVDYDEYMTARGFVKYKGRYVTQQEYDLAVKSQAERQRELEWYPQIRLWTTWLSAKESLRTQALNEFAQLQDDDAAPAVQRFLAEHPTSDVRRLAITVLQKMAGPKATTVLAKRVLFEPEPSLRLAALEALPTKQRDIARAEFLKGLRHEANPVVCRAGWGLQRVGDARVIPGLIEALNTQHPYTVRVPAGTTYSFAADGSGWGTTSGLPPEIELGLRAGQYPQGVIVLNPPGSQIPMKTVTVRVTLQNAEVLTALQHLTGQNFGYDERLWRLWWAAQQAAGTPVIPSAEPAT